MGRFTNDGIRFHVDDLTPIGGSLGGPIDIGAIEAMDIVDDIATSQDSGGQLYDQTSSVVGKRTRLDFSSKSLRQLFTILSGGYYCYGGGTYPGNVDGTHPGLEFYGRRLQRCKDAAPGSNHPKFTSAQGLLVAGTLTAMRGQDAMLSVTAHCLSADGSESLAEVYNATPLTTLVEEQFSIGHSMINDIGLTDQVAGIELAWGVVVGDLLPDMGEIEPSSASVRKIRPRLSLPGLDPSLAASLPTGTNLTHSDTIFQLRKRADRSDWVSSATAEHIRITLEGMLIRDNRWSGSGSDDATCAWTLEGLDDGAGTSPIVVNPSIAYDTDLTS